MSAGRSDILAAARREFADRGFAGATTAGIARRAGVTQPLVHHHFGSKQGLWEAVLGELFGALRASLDEVIAASEGAPRRERLERLLRCFVRAIGTNPALSRLIRNESSGGGQAFDALYDAWLRPLVDLFRDELEAAIADGTLRPVDPRLAYSLVVGVCTQPFAEPETVARAFDLDVREPEVIERYAELAVSVLLRGLSAAGDDPPA